MCPVNNGKEKQDMQMGQSKGMSKEELIL